MPSAFKLFFLSNLLTIVMVFQFIFVQDIQVVSAQTTEEELLHKRMQSESARNLWNELQESLANLGERWGEQNQLPEWTMIPGRNSQRKNKKKIDQIALHLMESVGESPLDKILKERRALVDKIKRVQEETAQLEEQAFMAPEKGGLFKKSRADYEANVKSNQEQIKLMKTELGVLMVKIKQTFEEMGLNISQEQVNDLFVVITGESMRNFFIRFSNLKLLSEVIAHHITRSKSSKGYAGQAKRYYAIYVALVYMLVEAHERTIKRISEIHIPKVRQLTQKTQDQVAQTKAQLLRPEQKSNYEIFEANLAEQEKLLTASQNYEAYLMKQKVKIEETATELKLRFEAVLNTYRTISLAKSLLDSMQGGFKDINELQNLTLPKMLPLSDEKLRSEFDLVTGTLKSDDPSDWNKR